MKGLRERFRNKKGFTLIEMLIVVAVIAILVAVSIPLVSNALDRARHATDQANERAAKAELIIQYLAENDAVIDGAKGQIKVDTNYYYDAANGAIKSGRNGITPYGQCTKGDHATKFIAMKIDANGVVTMDWTNNAGVTDGSTLCSGKDISH